MEQLNLFSENGKITLEELFEAYFDCRKSKRRTYNALAFEGDFEHNLIELYEEINNGTYYPGKSIAFIVNKPVKREIFAADFRDRIVHHLIINKLIKAIEKNFIEDTYSCRKGKGTLFGVKKVYSYLEQASQGFTKDCYILKMDIRAFFMSIDKKILFRQLEKFIINNYQQEDKGQLLELVQKVVCHRPAKDCRIKGRKSNWKGLPRSKSLFWTHPTKGLPIGNLTSQIFANFYMDVFDKFIQNQKGVKYYGRYVDDFVIIHEDKDFLCRLKKEIAVFLSTQLNLQVHPNKIYLQHYSKGVKFVGAVIKPGRIYISNRTKTNFFCAVKEFNRRLNATESYGKKYLEKFCASVNSYLGYIKHYSTYKIRRKILWQVLHNNWWAYIYTYGALNKISIKSLYKPRLELRLKLRCHNYENIC